MDKRKAAFIVTAVGAILAGAVAPLASNAECFIYKFTTQPVVVESQPVTVRRFVDRMQPTVTFESPVQMERVISKPVLMDQCVQAPVLMDQCAPPAAVISQPVMVEKQLSAPVCVDRCNSNPVLLDRPTVTPRLINNSRVISSPVLMNGGAAFSPRLVGNTRLIDRTLVNSVLTSGGPRAEMLQQLRTLGLPILIDSSDLNDWDEVKIRRKKFGGIRQTVLHVTD